MLAWAVATYVFVWVVTDLQGGYRGPFKGRVVDAETRQPIQGAVVFMTWTLATPTPAGAVHEDYDAEEVLTDERGYFSIKKKWSWNPWINWMVDASALIYKSGYGAPHNLGTPWLRKRAESQRGRSPEERKQLGPAFYFDIEFESGSPVFLLQRLKTHQEQERNLDAEVSYKDSRKMRLLRLEQNRQARALGREDAVYPIPEE